MITQPSEYEFVDFANGDLPTGNFNGQVMPLRQGDAQNILKAEDIAFLQEGMLERYNAWNGVKAVKGNYSSTAASSYLLTPDVPNDSVVPTRRISASQMSNIRAAAIQATDQVLYVGGTLPDGITLHMNYLSAAFSGADQVDTTGRYTNGSQARAAWIAPYFLSSAAIEQDIPLNTFSRGAAVVKQPILTLFGTLQGLRLTALGGYVPGAGSAANIFLDPTNPTITAASGGWTATPSLVTDGWGFERDSSDPSNSMYIFPRTQQAFSVPTTKMHLDLANGNMWFLLIIRTEWSNGNSSYRFAFVRIPHDVQQELQSGRPYVRIGGTVSGVSGRDFLLKFVSLMQKLGVDYGSTQTPYVRYVLIRQVGAYFVCGLDGHTKWW